MTTYLVTLSLGPVQSLIGSARRTRDLWCGSWLLAEAAKAAALTLHQGGASLIFPCPTDASSELAPSGKPKDSDANIANILRAELVADHPDAVRALLDLARGAAVARLVKLSGKAKEELNKFGLPLHDDLWRAQESDILETFAAWVEVGDDYPAAAKRLATILAARKATRDFLPAASKPEGLGAGIPKSSLDAARESVVNVSSQDRKAGKHKTALRRLGLNLGEQLDVLGVAKRMAGAIDQFTAYSRIAADAWVESLLNEQCQRISAAYEPLVEAGLTTRTKGNADIYRKLPFDAQLVFDFRMDNALAAADLDDGDKRKLETLRATLKDLDEPVPYAVILKADGDRMGELLSQARTADQSRQVSRALHVFAQSVRGLVREHRGHAIYAGGDDVLALLPLQNAVACARELSRNFAKAMDEVAQQLGVPAEARPTLSVGLGLGHVLEPLGRLRERADAAEALAKGNGEPKPRNALAIRLGIRSGTELTWRGRWEDEAALTALKDFIAAYRDEKQPCPSRLGYDLRAIALRLEWATEESCTLPGIHAAELARTLERARLRGGEGELSEKLKSRVKDRAEQTGLSRLADELIIARWLSARTKADIGAME